MTDATYRPTKALKITH